MTEILKDIGTKHIIETNNLIKPASSVAREEVCLDVKERKYNGNNNKKRSKESVILRGRDLAVVIDDLKQRLTAKKVKMVK